MNYQEAKEAACKYVNVGGRVPQDIINKIADEIILREAQASYHKPAKPPEKKFCTEPQENKVKITVTIESDSEDFLDTPIIITRLNGRKEIIR